MVGPQRQRSNAKGDLWEGQFLAGHSEDGFSTALTKVFRWIVQNSGSTSDPADMFSAMMSAAVSVEQQGVKL